VDMDAALFERSVRLAIALEQIVKEYKFDAFCAFDQVWLTDPRVGVIPSYGTGRLCELGIPAAPEGDVNTAVAQVILQELAGTATTLENYVIDYDQNAVMFSHDGHGNPAMGTPGGVKVKHSIYYHGVHGFGAGFEFAYKPGHITNLSVVTTGLNQWRFVISEGELLPFPPREISAPQTLFRHDSLSIADWCDGWLSAGATHHQGAAYGSWTPQLLHLADMLGIEAVVV
jgi:L-arabinose isomerase